MRPPLAEKVTKAVVVGSVDEEESAARVIPPLADGGLRDELVSHDKRLLTLELQTKTKKMSEVGEGHVFI